MSGCIRVTHVRTHPNAGSFTHIFAHIQACMCTHTDTHKVHRGRIHPQGLKQFLAFNKAFLNKNMDKPGAVI